MKKLSPLEFKDYISNMPVNTFIFSSSNQNWQSIEDTMSLELTFKKMIMTFSPNTMFFVGNPSTLRLDRVKSIKVRETSCVLGTVFTVICGSTDTKTYDKEYTLIAR